MTTATELAVDFDRLAANLRHLYQTAQGLVNKKSEIAWSRFLGACDAANAVGIGMTPFAVELAVQDAFGAQFDTAGARPAYHPANNSPQKAWDEELRITIATKLRGIS